MLGFDITKDCRDLHNNFNTAVEKIRSIIRFWYRFRLSLPGRINVAKTLLLSQICFHGSIIPVNDGKLNEVQSLINDFISAKMCIGREAITTVPSKGGLGFPNLTDFVQSLHCSWVKRALQCSIPGSPNGIISIPFWGVLE
jgi:hypothetical protein